MDTTKEQREKYWAGVRELAGKIAAEMEDVPPAVRAEDFYKVFESFAPSRGGWGWSDLFSDELALFLTNHKDEAQYFLEDQNETLSFSVKMEEDGDEWTEEFQASMDELRDLDTLAAWLDGGIEIGDAIYGAIRGDVLDELTKMGFIIVDEEIVREHPQQRRSPPCPFCRIDPERVVAQNDVAFAIRDNFPVHPGHTLVIPQRHVASWFDATEAERLGVMELVDKVKLELDGTDPRPDGYNVGVNVGEAAGQTVMHLHVHLIPRFVGDVEDPRGGVRWVAVGSGAVAAHPT